MVRIADWLRPRDGWGLLLLTLLTGVFLATAVAVAEWVQGGELLVPAAVAALIVGRWAACTSWRPITHALYGAVSGLLISLILAAGEIGMLPSLMDRWRGWVLAATWGGVTRDPSIFLLYSLLLIWGALFFAGWRGARFRGGLPGFLPVVTLSAVSVFYSEKGALALFGGMLSWLILVGVGNLRAHKDAWELRHIDYAADLEFDVVLAAGLIAAALVLVGLFLPAFSVEGFVRWVNETFARPAQLVETEARRLFAGVRPPQRQGGVHGAGGLDVLLSDHLISGYPDLGQEEVFRVLGDDPALPYWRGVTYDYYTGGGWQIMADTAEAVAGNLSVVDLPRFQILTQRVSHTRAGEGTVYAAGDIVTVEGGDITAHWRGPGDLAGLLVSSSAYTVTSIVAQPTPDELRATTTAYPSEAAIYLQLPSGLPDRVRNLAREVTEEATTPYDRAVRLEQYLRGYPYSLDVPPPPPDRDITDFFLFDLGEGYCDYYATAFVVMARTVGLPSRLAVGYVGGRAGPEPWARVVVEENAHSWPEVLFPGWGWVRFEPTSARPEVAQHVEDSPGTLPEERLPRQPTTVRLSTLLAAVVLILAVSVALVARAWRNSRDRIPKPGLPSAWRMLVRAGSALGSSHQPGQTVFEYTAAVSGTVTLRAADARWRRGTWSARAADVNRALDLFATAYSRYLYGGGPEVGEPPAELWRELDRMRRVPLFHRRDR